MYDVRWRDATGAAHSDVRYSKKDAEAYEDEKRRLQRRKRLQRQEPLEPELLADGQEVPVVQECGARCGQGPAHGAHADIAKLHLEPFSARGAARREDRAYARSAH